MRSYGFKNTNSNATPPLESVLKEIPVIQPFKYKLLPDKFTRSEKRIPKEKKKKIIPRCYNGCARDLIARLGRPVRDIM